MKDKLKADCITKGVTFNVADPDQKELYEYAMLRTNFSGYMKRLIQRDMDSQKRNAPAAKTTSGGIKLDLRN